MPELKSKSVAINTVWENKARTTGRIFWKIVTGTENFTCFTRELVARFIDGQAGQQKNESLVFNFRPPLETTLWYEETATGLVLTKPPDGTPDAPVTRSEAQAQTAPAPGQGYNVGTPPGFRGGRSYGGGQKGSGWKPEDKRPSLVTMTFSYAKDQVGEIIAHSADLSNQDPDAVVRWAEDATKKLARSYLTYALDELRALGFDPKEAAK